MIGTIAITDEGWYSFLEARPALTEVNFWTPSARRAFRALQFSPFLFKLRAPFNAVCGFAYFAHFSPLPDWLAWQLFDAGNGCPSFADMHDRIAHIRERIRYDEATGSDEIGCIQLVSPVFFPKEHWIPQPTDWKPRTQTAVKYDLSTGEGLRVWEACLNHVKSLPVPTAATGFFLATESPARYGDPRLIEPRLGQGSFRSVVLDAYGRACAVTAEHSLPALEAAHIQSYSDDGPHDIRNGLLLRADLHRLFDTGYVTVTPDLRFEVSRRLRTEFKNGKSYYPFHGARVQVPQIASHQPDRSFLTWHNERRFRG